MTVVFVVNPMAQAGRTGRRLDELATLAAEHLGDDVRIAPTQGPADGIRVAREAAEAGATMVVAVGGDGTANEVVEGLMTAEGDTPAFALLPSGTGSDLARTLALPKGWDAALAAIAAATPRACDVMRGTFGQADGTTTVRHGINVCGMGMAGDVVRRVNEGSKVLGGKASFAIHTLGSLLAWRPPEVEVRWTEADGSRGSWSGRLVNLFANNGRYCGGGMCTGPSAHLADGLLDVVVIPQRSTLKLVTSTPHLYDGTLVDDPSVVAFQAQRLEVRATAGDTVPCDIDGEQPGQLPATLEVLPTALRIAAPFLPGA